MHIPAPFRVSRSEALALAERRGFGLVCAYDGAKPAVSWARFHRGYAADGSAVATFHLARQNPLCAAAVRQSPWLLAVSEADAYISPRWYGHVNVPTWNYQIAHVYGTVRELHGEALRRLLSRLISQHEGASPYRLETLPEEFIQRAIGMPDRPYRRLSQRAAPSSIQLAGSRYRDRSTRPPACARRGCSARGSPWQRHHRRSRSRPSSPRPRHS